MPSPHRNTTTANCFELNLYHDFCIGWGNVDLTNIDDLRFFLLREYGRESAFLCDSSIAYRKMKNDASLADRASRLRAVVADLVYPYCVDTFLGRTFPAMATIAEHLQEWRGDRWAHPQQAAFPAVKTWRGTNLYTYLHDPAADTKARPRYDAGRVRYVRPDQLGRTLLVCQAPLLMWGVEGAQWKLQRSNISSDWNVDPQVTDPLSGWDRRYNRAIACDDLGAEEQSTAPCVAVVVKQEMLDQLPSMRLEHDILAAAQQALKCPNLGGSLLSFKVTAIDDESLSVAIDSAVADGVAAAGDLSNAVVVVFPEAALSPGKIASTSTWFHRTFLRHPKAAIGTPVATAPLEEWSDGKLKTALRALWSFRFVHSVPDRAKFSKRFGEWRKKRNPSANEIHFQTDVSKADSIHRSADRVPGYIKEIFPNLDGRLWREEGRTE